MTIRAYVNGRGVDVAEGGTALDAVRALDAALAGELAAGTRALTDSRGLPVPADAAAYHGAIYRVVGARPREGGGDAA